MTMHTAYVFLAGLIVGNVVTWGVFAWKLRRGKP